MNLSSRMELNPYEPGKSMLQAPQALGATSASAALYDYLYQAKLPQEARVLELGSGSGILSIMLALAYPEWRITGIEIQEELHRLSQLNARELNLQIDFVQADLRNFQSETPYDLIFANPPWQILGHGILSPDPMRAISRSEVSCTMDDVVSCLTRNLRLSGQAILLYPPSRAKEAEAKAKQANLNLNNREENPPHWSILHFTKG